MNMIASADGASSAGGLSGALGGPADQALFATLRALADVILVGAGTMRAEGYGPARLAADLRASRLAGGWPAVPPIAVVTRSCRLEWHSPFFTEAEQRPLVLTVAGADAGNRRRAEDVAEVIVAGERHVDLARALAALADRGAESVLVEGGPSLNAQLMAGDLIDELCLTVSPTLVGGDARRIATGTAMHPPVPLILAHVAEEDDLLLLRYRRP
jgi:riboflavin biosynthesis pyrimidine reductase